LIGALWLNFAVSIGAGAIDLWGVQVIDAFGADRATIDDLDRFDAVFAVYGFVEIVIYVTAVVAWLAWQSRTVENESPIGIGPSPWSPRRSMGWWFVPFANLVQPYRIHRDIYRRHHSGDGTNIGLVKVWWAAWLLASILTNAAGRLWLRADSLNDLQAGLAFWLIADIASALLVFPAVALVRRIQDRAEELARNVTSTPALPEPPAVIGPAI
jgi:hypothetical protein